MFPMSLLLIMRSMTKSMINQAKALWSNDHKRRVTRPVTPTCPAAASQGWAHCVCVSLWQITVASPVCVLNRQNYLHIKEHNILVSHTYGLWIAGGDNWAKKHGKWHRTTVCEQLLPEIEKAQSVAPQTTKYRYRTVISDQWIHWKF